MHPTHLLAPKVSVRANTDASDLVESDGVGVVRVFLGQLAVDVNAGHDLVICGYAVLAVSTSDSNVMPTLLKVLKAMASVRRFLLGGQERRELDVLPVEALGDVEHYDELEGGNVAEEGDAVVGAFWGEELEPEGDSKAVA